MECQFGTIFFIIKNIYAAAIKLWIIKIRESEITSQAINTNVIRTSKCKNWIVYEHNDIICQSILDFKIIVIFLAVTS